MIRVLHIVGKMHRAGQETFLMNLYRNIDRDKVQFDFAVGTKEPQDYDEEIRRLGGQVHYVEPMSHGLFRHYRSLKELMIREKYDVIHRHTANAYVFIDLLAAKNCDIRKRFIHSHSDDAAHGLLNRICRAGVNALSTQRFACSQSAGRWLYGNKKDFKVIQNGIDMEDFFFDPKVRAKVRQSYDLKDEEIVIGHVGRFVEQKNHKFLIEVFREALSMNPACKLMLVGDGELKTHIQQWAKKLGVFENIRFLGSMDNVGDLMMAMDIFVFPSINEGLGIVGIEAQASGLHCVFSDAIPSEGVLLKDRVDVLSLTRSPKEWATHILNCSRLNRNIDHHAIIESGYSIKRVAERFESEYYV